MDEFIPDDKFKPDEAVSANSGGGPEFISDDKFLSDEDKYGTLTEQIKTGVEGLAKGIAGPLATAAEVALFDNAKEQLAREEANPTLSGTAKAVGFIAPAVASLGSSAAARLGIAGASKLTQLGALEKVGAGVGAGLAKVGIGGPGAGLVSQVTAGTVKGAFENALFQGGEEISKMILQDPKQGAHSAIADIGLAAAIGGATGGVLGGIFRSKGLPKEPIAPSFVSEADRAAMEAGDFVSSIENSNIINQVEKKGIIAGLREQKPDAKEIQEAAKRLGAPVMEGMTSASSMVQKAEDSLINGVPTFSGMKRQNLYKAGSDKAHEAIESALANENVYSKVELGNLMKQDLTKQIAEQNAPISELYNEIKKSYDIIPLSENAAATLSKELRGMRELSLTPGTPQGALVKRVIREIGNVKTLDDLKFYKSSIRGSLPAGASAEEKRMASILTDMMTDIEENSIERFASKMAKTPEQQQKVLGLIGQRKEANQMYKGLIGKVQTLSEQLGKGRVYGIQDAIHFINDLTPEQVTQKLFAKNNSEFMNFFSKEFPEQMKLMRSYQKAELKEAASATGELSAKVLFNKVNTLEPEIKKLLFSTEELQKLTDAEKYLRAFPKNFNPSGTAGMTAFRELYQKPTRATLANVGDYSIEKFIKYFGSPEIGNAAKIGNATVRGVKSLNKGVKDVFNPSKSMTLTNVGSTQALMKLVDEYSEKPEKMLTMGDNNPIPEYAEEFAGVAMRAVQYLTSIKPKNDIKSPLDSKLPVSVAEQSSYNRAIQIAQSPLVVLKAVRDGTLVPQDVMALRTIYPDLYRQMAHKMTDEMIEHTAKGKTIPYKTRMSMGLFLGQALDSTMTPQSILSVQNQSQQQQQPQPQQASPKGGRINQGAAKGLNKIAASAQTPDQARLNEKATQH